jgi:hypothetical protein
MRARGMMIDFVVVNEQASSYVQDLQRAVETLCENSRLRGKELGPRQHIFAVRRDLMDEATYKTLLAVARVCPAHAQWHHLRPDRARRGGSAAGSRRLAAAQATDRNCRRDLHAANVASRSAPMSAPMDGLSQWNGFGGFDGDGPHYVVRLATAPHDAAAVDQRRLQRLVRLPHLRRGCCLHLEPQQPRLPADAMVERSGHQPAGRGRSTSTIVPAARRSRRLPPWCAIPR